MDDSDFRERPEPKFPFPFFGFGAWTLDWGLDIRPGLGLGLVNKGYAEQRLMWIVMPGGYH